jgi:hypothetical protein
VIAANPFIGSRASCLYTVGVTAVSTNLYSSKDINISWTHLEVRGQLVPFMSIESLDASIDWTDRMRRRGFLDVLIFSFVVFAILGTMLAAFDVGSGSGITGFLTLLIVSIAIGISICVVDPIYTQRELGGHRFRVELKDGQRLEFSVLDYQNAKEIATAMYKAKGIWAGGSELWSD